ncbi:hypothetical protein [Nonomuraea fuscirosea]|uniref:hypothetical protein n=1 Tax=Nonomuraea fuscirosea TaxID=1291556 RepID=UPI0011B1D7F7|nr:hypothetical protein [Nonomuraea fuscirosea]
MTLVASVALVTGVVAPAASNSIRQDPYIGLDYDTGPAGTEVTVWGNLFLPNLPITISHPGLSGPDSTKADDVGAIPNLTFRVMENAPIGKITIQYRQAEHIIASADFTVQRR